MWAGLSCFHSSGDGYVGELLELQQGCEVYLEGLIIFLLYFIKVWGFPGGSEVKESAWNAEDPVSIHGLGRSPGEGNGNPLQHSCLENPVDREA